MSYMMSAGDLDRSLQIVTMTSTQDALGQPVATPVVGRTIRAQRLNLIATDIQRAQLLQQVAEVKYVTRYHSDITNGMRLREASVDYYVVSVEVVGRKEGLRILCRVAG